MCGIAGFVQSTRAEEDAARLRAMCDAIVHRGPDDAGYFVEGGVALGMRRLSIIDVAGGHQPIQNEDGSVVVVFNGEIYNFRELRSRLKGNGHTLRTSSDTECLVHLYEDCGEDLVQELRGMFAFAIWDRKRRRLFAARDRLGIKPLYYWEHAGGVGFASEQRAILALGEFQPRISEPALLDFFALGYVPEPRSIFDGVSKLLPGHSLTWSAEEGLRTRRYWSPILPERRVGSEADVIAELRHLLDEAVQIHLESEVPLGAFFSGGVDSSAVVATMQRMTREPVRTFSIGFDQASFDESAHAARMAKILGTVHTELIVNPEIDALIEDVVQAFDEPFADSSAVPTYLVSRLAREHVTVALSGDGGDELFGGYTRYREMSALGGVLPGFVRRPLRRLALALPGGARGRNRMLTLARGYEGRYAAAMALPAAPVEGGVVAAELLVKARPFDSLLEPWFEPSRGRDPATQLMLVDLQTYLPGDILTKVDRASMASSLEARVPLLDHVLAEFAIGLPANLKIGTDSGKWIFKRAIADRVPPEVLSYPKRGFGVPLVHWFRRELAYRIDAITSSRALIAGYIDPAAVRAVVSEHRTGRRDHSHQLWRLLVLELWLGSLQRGDLKRPTMSPKVAAFVGAGGGSRRV